jgi:ADP-ribosylglycohydrolase
MIRYLFIALLAASVLQASAQKPAVPKKIVLNKEQLKDKIMGGWAGQTIAVTFGGPYEFRFNGTFIQDYQPLVWYDGYLKKTMIDNPGLYDDLYMDLTFVDVFEKYGLDAPVDSFANAFAHAGYMLWHANQAARYNLLNGIKAPQSGYWMNNPHSDDIDYQIESDFAGLMSPAMPNTASKISDKIGHIMNYGDGWYGGVFIGAMYTLTFTSNDIHHIVNEALKTIPPKSTYYQCISDVIKWQKQYPNDWHQTWFELQKKWSSDVGCPDGVFDAFDIDSKLNSAYVVLALLYGNGDYTKTLKIAARCGEDADCNPSTVGGVLGAMLGYKKIPAYWKMGLKDAESIDFKYTTMSLNKVYEIGYKHALDNIKRNGGTINGDKVTIPLQVPQTVRLEQGFANMYPLQKTESQKEIGTDDLTFDFTGTGFVLRGDAEKKKSEAPDYVFEAELYIDGVKTETAKLPTNFTTRRHELFWRYYLSEGKHTVRVKVLNPNPDYELNSAGYLVYGSKK